MKLKKSKTESGLFFLGKKKKIKTVEGTYSQNGTDKLGILQYIIQGQLQLKENSHDSK